MMYLDEQVSIFVYRKILKVLFKIKDKTRNDKDKNLVNLFIREVKNEMDEIFIKVNTRRNDN